MKVLHIIPSLRKGGAERLVIEIVRELSKRSGIEVRLVVFRNEIEYTVSDIKQLVHIIPSSVSLSLWKRNKYNVEELHRFIENFGPDVIHTHLFEAEIVSRSLFYPHAVWVSHCHDNMYQLATLRINTFFSKSKLTAYYERLYLLKRYRMNGRNQFIAISSHTRDYFSVVLPWDLRNIVLLPNAINTSNFKRPQEYVPTRKADLELIMVGSLVDKKNQTLLLDVVNLLNTKKYNAHLHILGDGKNKRTLEEKVKTLGIADLVTLHGNVSKVETFLWNCDIYVHSALYEPFGLVLLEAMAAGLPVISLNGGGNQDIIEQGKNGFIIDSAQPELFAEKIIYLWENKDAYRKMSAYAQAYAINFDMVSYVTRLIDIYKQ